MSTITTAAREYARRPNDEKFPSLPALVEHCTKEKSLTAEKNYNLRDLHFVPIVTGTQGTQIADRQVPTDRQEVQIESPRGRAKLTHWSFGQLCRDLETPAGFLRESVPAALAADVLNYRITQAPAGKSITTLIRAGEIKPLSLDGAREQATIRAATSDSYGRVWDADLYGQIARTFGQDGAWQLPPTWEGGPDGPRAGAYRGDRDSFLILTNGGSIVTDPSLAAYSNTPGNDSGAGNLYRGIMVRNSEVGAASVVIETILFRYICGNHMLWGAIYDKQFRRRHVGAKVLRDTIQMINRTAREWSNRPASTDEAIIKGLINLELAATAAAVIDELRAIGATREQAEAAYKKCEQTENASPRSYWGAAQGFTRLSQESPYQDERYRLDQFAATVMARGAKKVAA